MSGLQFKRSFKRNDKPICSAVCQFLAHLINQQVADDMLAFEVAILLLDNPSGGHPSTPQPQRQLPLMWAIVYPSDIKASGPLLHLRRLASGRFSLTMALSRAVSQQDTGTAR